VRTARFPPAPARAGLLGLAILLILTGAFLFYETRGTTFWFDEWQWVVERRGFDVGTFLRPHNEHLSLIPIAIYKLLFVTAGLDSYAPYRAVVIALHLVCGALIFVYVSRRLGPAPGLLVAALILTLGPGWQGFIWTFQITWLSTLGAGVGALLMLDRGDRRGDLAAAALLAVSLASSAIGVPIAIGITVEVLWRRRDHPAAWTLAVPLALYALWWLGYGDPGQFVRHNITLVPRFAADSAASALSALTGLHGNPITEDGAELDPTAGTAWGRPLATAALVLLVLRLRQMTPVLPRVWSLGAVLVSFWVLTGLERAHVGAPDTSRYLFVSGVFMVLLFADLARGISPPRGAAVFAALAVAAAITANLGDLRAGTRFLRAQAPGARADLGVLEHTRPLLPPGYLATHFPGYPYVRIRADAYFAAAKANGSPAASEAEIAASRESARAIADAELTVIHRVRLQPSRPHVPVKAPPRVEAAVGGTVTARGGCLHFGPVAAEPPGVTPTLDLDLPPGGILFTATGGSATVAVRRFAVGFPPDALAKLSASASATLRIGPDGIRHPWHVRVVPSERVTACGLG
jgi:hypothetical protein